MRKTISIIIAILTICTSLILYSGCNGYGVKVDRDYLLGFVDGCYDINSEVESSLTADYIADTVQMFGGKSFRLWMHFTRIVSVNSNNEVVINQENAQKFHNLINKLKNAGVERFICMTSNYIYPYNYGVTSNDVVPDPFSQNDEYITFLKLFGECFRVLAQEFPEINYFEPTNEPDLINGQNLCKNGYDWGNRDNGDNANYIYNDRDNAHIVVDMCYYASEAVKSVNKDNQVLLPGLCGYYSTVDYLGYIYDAIKSKCHPTGKTYSDNRPNSYFTILNWHPYLLGGEGVSTMDESWVQLQKDIYAVAKNNGDGNKKVWFTEIGFSDRGMSELEEDCADNLVKMLNYVKNDLPFVETVFIFRLTNLTGNASMSDYEDNFGLFRSVNDDNTLIAGEPKPIAISLYKYFKGDSADLSVLYKFSK